MPLGPTIANRLVRSSLQAEQAGPVIGDRDGWSAGYTLAAGARGAGGSQGSQLAPIAPALLSASQRRGTRLRQQLLPLLPTHSPKVEVVEESGAAGVAKVDIGKAQDGGRGCRAAAGATGGAQVGVG
jgi:hypothetical protein